MKPPNTVIERGLGGPICGECAAVLPVTGEHTHICLTCQPQYEFSSLLDENGLRILKSTMDALDLSAKAVIKRWMRLGQMVSKHVSEGNPNVGYLDDQGDFHGFFDTLPKMAPSPGELHPCPNSQCVQIDGHIHHHSTCPHHVPCLRGHIQEKINPDPGDIRHGL